MELTRELNRSVSELNRVEALQNAVRHRMREETPADVVRSAELYFAFLQGTSAEQAK